MGTTIELVLWGVDSSLADVVVTELRERADRWERIFSRFRPDSELCRVNHHRGAWVSTSSPFVSVLRVAIEGHSTTEGRFDPTLLDALERLGYDRSFEELHSRGGARFEADARPPFSDRELWEIEIDQDRGAVRLPTGLRVDLGGVAKGAFVDSVDDLVGEMPGAIVDAGGDLRAWGTPGAEDTWRVGVQHPGQLSLDIANLLLPAGESVAIATSSTRSRTWFADGSRQNHLLDPRDGRAVAWSTPSVTTVAATVAAAEIEAKSILVALARGERMPDTTACFVLVAHENGSYETVNPHANVA